MDFVEEFGTNMWAKMPRGCVRKGLVTSPSVPLESVAHLGNDIFSYYVPMRHAEGYHHGFSSFFSLKT